MPEPNENPEQNCTIRIHLIIDSARQKKKLKNKETGWYSNPSYQISRVLICTWTAAIILGSPLSSAAKRTASHQPHGDRLKAMAEIQPLSPAQGRPSRSPEIGNKRWAGFLDLLLIRLPLTGGKERAILSVLGLGILDNHRTSFLGLFALL